MRISTIFRFVCILLLWLALCVLVVFSDALNFMKVFVVIASGIIVFVPLYKKHYRK